MGLAMIELYYYENSVCSERALMALDEKGVEFWTGHHLDLFKGEQASPEYVKLNPKAQVPTLVHDGKVIRESSIVCDYLDDLYPAPALKPQGIAERARMREWIKDADDAGFTGVGALSFTAVFRDKLARKSDEERNTLWGEQTDLARTIRQKSCFEEGLNSPHALIALSAWEHIFQNLEENLSDKRTWIMGDHFTLADLNYAPLVARLEAIQFLDIWLEHRPYTQAWWGLLKDRPSFSKAKVGPGEGVEREEFAREGGKVAGQARDLLHAMKK